MSSQTSLGQAKAGNPFVGREDELDQLIAAWEETRSGHGRLAMLAGEPGIGKTRLAQELVERL